MKINLEVCLDNIESIDTCSEVGIDRVELCSALALGGLTPAYSTVFYAVKRSKIISYAMIRPRAGDFCYSSSELQMMKEEIKAMAEIGVNGVVFGVLTPNLEINFHAAEGIVKAAKQFNLGTTFHRAFDFVPDYRKSIDILVKLGIDRILTSGLADKAPAGAKVIADAIKYADGRICIMAGSGVNSVNVSSLIKETDVKEVHCSASCMKTVSNATLKLGSSSSDLSYQITDKEHLLKIKRAIESM